MEKEKQRDEMIELEKRVRTAKKDRGEKKDDGNEEEEEEETSWKETVCNYLEYLPLSFYCRASLGFMTAVSVCVRVCVIFPSLGM